MKKILILGASYGSLLGAKLALAGHAVTLVCLPAEVEAFNRDGARVRLPIKGREGLVEIDTRKAPGKLDAAGPGAVDPKHYDLVALAMQEPQKGSVDCQQQNKGPASNHQRPGCQQGKAERGKGEG